MIECEFKIEGYICAEELLWEIAAQRLKINMREPVDALLSCDQPFVPFARIEVEEQRERSAHERVRWAKWALDPGQGVDPR